MFRSHRSGASLVAQMVKNLPEMQEIWVRFLVGKIPWRREWLATPAFLAGKFHGQRSLVGYSPLGCREQLAHTCAWAHTHTRRRTDTHTRWRTHTHTHTHTHTRWRTTSSPFAQDFPGSSPESCRSSVLRTPQSPRQTKTAAEFITKSQLW